MLSKDKLIYDATTPADGDSVAAFADEEMQNSISPDFTS